MQPRTYSNSRASRERREIARRQSFDRYWIDDRARV